jgi:hypothetical protein
MDILDNFEKEVIPSISHLFRKKRIDMLQCTRIERRQQRELKLALIRRQKLKVYTDRRNTTKQYTPSGTINRFEKNDSDERDGG